VFTGLHPIHTWLILFWQVGDFDPSQLLVPRAYHQIKMGTAYAQVEKLLAQPSCEGPHTYYVNFVFGCELTWGCHGVASWETKFCTVGIHYDKGTVIDKRFWLKPSGIDACHQLRDLRSQLDSSILAPFFRLWYSWTQ
jgi:hypothetical protein